MSFICCPTGPVCTFHVIVNLQLILEFELLNLHKNYRTISLDLSKIVYILTYFFKIFFDKSSLLNTLHFVFFRTLLPTYSHAK